jgi:toxin ParE1/3/4
VKPLLRRTQADADIAAAIDYYPAAQAPEAALRWVDALEAAYRHLQRHPATGSPRHAHELNLPGLRAWPLKRFPYLVFYREMDEQIEVWRVLHMERDIPAWLREDT